MQLNSDNLLTLSKKVELKPYCARVWPEREYLTDAEILSSTDHPAFVNVESYPNYFLITFKINGKFVHLDCGEGRSFNNKFLSWIMHNYKTVGFNSLKFDLLILWLSYTTQDTRVLKRATKDLIIKGVREHELKKEYGFFTFKTTHVDLIEVAPLKGSLKLYGARLHTHSIQDQPFDVDKELTDFEIEELRQFNCNQLCITQELFEFMKERLELRESLGREYGENLMSKSDAQIAEVVLAKEVAKLNGKRPTKEIIQAGTIYRYSIPHYIRYQSQELNDLLGKIRAARFVVNGYGKIDLPKELETSVRIGANSYRLGIGGLHSTEKSVAYLSNTSRSIIDRDVASYYPRLITTLGLYPASCGPNFLVAFNKIIDVRLDAKARKIFSRDKGLKIVINGTSGKLSDEWSIFYSPYNTIQMTVSGQLALLMKIEMLESVGIQVISANTDGIVMLVSDAQYNDYLNCVAQWEQITGFVTEETKYKTYCARDVNSYFAVKEDGKVKTKGPYSEVGSQSGTKLDTNPSSLICTDAISALLAYNTPLEETILNCKDFSRFVTVRQVKGGAHKNREYLGKVIRWAYIKGETGTINYVSNNNKVPDTDGAVPFMDMPDEWPDINYSWYLNKCEEILYDIGYKTKPKQIAFF